MEIVTLGGIILLGFVAGYFLSVYAIIALSTISIGFGVYLWFTMKEMAQLFTFIYVVIALIANAAMWVTHYDVTTQTFIGDLLHTYILR